MDVYEKILAGEDIGSIMKELMQREELRKLGKEISKFVKDAVSDLRKLTAQDRERYSTRIDEYSAISKAVEFLEKEFGADVIVQSAENPERDPGGKAKFARPLKPAIYVE